MVAHTVNSSLDMVLGWRALDPRRRGAFALSRGVTLVDREDPLSPLLSWAQSVDTVFADVVLDSPELMRNMTEEFVVLSQSLNPLEVGNKVQCDESLRVHVLPKEQVLAQVVNGEVVFTIILLESCQFGKDEENLQLHRNHAHKRERLHVRLVRERRHGAGGHRLVGSIHGVDVGREGVDTIHGRVRQRGRPQRNAVVHALVVTKRLGMNEGVLHGVVKGGLRAMSRVATTAPVRTTPSALGTRVTTLPVVVVVVVLAIGVETTKVSRLGSILETAVLGHTVAGLGINGQRSPVALVGRLVVPREALGMTRE